MLSLHDALPSYGEETAAFTSEPCGWIALGEAPAVGAVVTAGFAFDVPVRFAEDHLSVTRATFLAGEAPAVPLIALRAVLDGGLSPRRPDDDGLLLAAGAARRRATRADEARLRHEERRDATTRRAVGGASLGESV